MKKLPLLLLFTPVFAFAQRAPATSPLAPIIEGIGVTYGDMIIVFITVAGTIFATKMFWTHIDFIVDYVKTVSGRNR